MTDRIYQAFEKQRKQIIAHYEQYAFSSMKAKIDGSPHFRPAHYALYWYRNKGQYERYTFKWIPITLVGGSIKQVD